MERIFKVKTRSDRNPQGLYPSERRYSASIVLGLSVVFVILSLFAVFMGTLLVHRITVYKTNSNSSDNFTIIENRTEFNDDRFVKNIEKDLIFTSNSDHYFINMPALIGVGCYLMALGGVLSFGTGLLAWKKWYIDHNITFFFLASCLSTLTSALAFLLSSLSILNYDVEQNVPISPLTLSLAMNIIILAVIVLIWSCLSAKLAYKGMKNNYPDDIVLGKGGRVEVNSVKKGNKKCSMIPPDILNQFAPPGKLAKYFPKKNNDDLPKEESYKEYQQRVNNFLENSESTEKN